MAFKIAYDAGHYNFTAGNRIPKQLDPNKTSEWAMNDRIARHFATAASQYEGVELLRTDDTTGKTDVSLANRCKKANDWGADFFVSMHHNAGANQTKAGGIVAFSYPNSKKGAEYRDAIYDACIAAGGLKGDRAVTKTTANFYVIRYTNAPAVLMEYGFMDSKTDAPVIVQEEYSKKMGYATMEAIAKVVGLKKKKQEEPKPEKKPAQEPEKKPAAKKKSVEEIAEEVIAGKWGTGAERQKKLKAAGYDYSAVQKAVNDKLSGKKPAATKSIDELAREVLAGKWGTGNTRKKKLKAAGYDYNAVQKRVNELLK